MQVHFTFKFLLKNIQPLCLSTLVFYLCNPQEYNELFSDKVEDEELDIFIHDEDAYPKQRRMSISAEKQENFEI